MRVALTILVAIHVIGTIGYRLLGPPGTTVMDAFFMTFITVSTIGYDEVIPLRGRPVAETFTAFLAFGGIGVMTFIFSTVTAFMLETNLSRAYRRKRMERDISRLKGHYIVCGAGRVGSYVIGEMLRDARPLVVIEPDEAIARALIESDQDVLVLEADATQDETLRRAGVDSAVGVFALTGDDALNLVISLSAKHLNPSARVVSRVHERQNEAKMLRAGADAIVSPDFTGGVRATALMVRPGTVSLLDQVMRTETGARIEEFKVPENVPSRPLDAIGRPHDRFILAIRRGGGWEFNPSTDAQVGPGDTLMVIANERGSRDLTEALRLP